MKDYQVVFEFFLTMVNLSQENVIIYFLGGLKHELNMIVKLTNPQIYAVKYQLLVLVVRAICSEIYGPYTS